MPWLRRGLALLVTLILVGILLAQISPVQVVQLLLSVSPGWLGLGFACYAVTNGFRALRASHLVSSRPVAATSLVPISFAQSLFNNILPARSGELSFIYLLGKRHQVPWGEATAVLISARVLDYLAVAGLFLTFGLAGLGEMTGHKWQLLMAAWLVMLLSVVILVVLARFGTLALRLVEAASGRLLPDSRLAAGLLTQMRAAVRAFEVILSQRRRLLPAIAYSLPIWLGTFAWFYAFMIGLGLRVTPVQLVLGATFAVLSKALPLGTVGGFGTHEAGWTVGFMLVGLEREMAIASGFAVNILTLLASLLFGLGSLGWMAWQWGRPMAWPVRETWG